MKKEDILIDRKTFDQLTADGLTELTNGHLGITLNLLSHLFEGLANLPHRTELNEQTETITADYRRLLHYMTEGSNDPSRDALHTRLIQKAFCIIQDLRRAYEMATNQTLYTHVAKACWEDWDRSALNHLLLQTDNSNFENQDILFTYIWTAPQLHPTEERQLKLFLCTAASHLRCYVLSALTMSLLSYFDAAKLRLLLEYASSEEEVERIRALVGICLTTQLYASAINLYPTLREDLILLFHQPQTIKEATTIQHYICLYQESERIRQRLEKEIIPTLIRVSMQRKKLGFSDMDIDLTEPDEELGIDRKTRKVLEVGMQEMARLFREGMDVNLHTFTSLKRFPFFQIIGHWLAPFVKERPEVPPIAAIHTLPICDNDKYSVCMLYKHLSEEQRNGMQKMLDEHSEVFAMNSDQVQNKEMQNVIQCLYRLIKRSPWTALFPNVFSEEMMFIDNETIGEELKKSTDFLHQTGETMLRHKHYEMAERHLSLYAQKAGSDYRLLMQLGRCAQEQGKFQRAIGHYLQASMLKPEDPQVLYRLQYCYAHIEHYNEQLDCLLKLEALQPDDPKILTETGLCLIQLERWEEATRRFYKLEFKGQRIVPSIRAIAWCNLRMGNYEEAQKYYTRILRTEMTSATWEDYLNAGHTTWLQGDMKTAIVLYQEYVHRYLTDNPKVTDALQPFLQDVPVLQASGISKKDTQLMYDILCMKL